MHALFEPRVVAVVGAHAEPGHVGYALMQNLLEGAHGRTIIPVTDRFSEVLGIRTIASLAEIEGEVDLAVIAVASVNVPDVLRACGAKKIPSVIVISAGFKEVGEEGAAMERELAAIAREFDIALLGPNCLGILNAPRDLNASFAAGGPPAGHVAFVSQSGAIATALIDHARAEGVGYSKIVSLGNEALLTEIEILEYLRDDDETHAILMYLEHVGNGVRFMELLKEITPKKPVVILRAGRSERGAGAVRSHTGSLAPDDAVFASAVAQAGAVSVETLRDLFNFAKLFHMGLTYPVTRLAIVTNGGGPSVNTSDMIGFSSSLALVSFDDATKDALRLVLPPMAAVGNPIDVIGDAGSARYRDTLEIVANLSSVDAILVIVTPQMMTNMKEIAETVSAFATRKPLIPSFMGGEGVDDALPALANCGLINFEFPTDAVAALDLLARGRSKEPAQVSAASATFPALVQCDMETTRTLLSSYGLTLAGSFAKDAEGISAALLEVGVGPYALKAISRDVVHKSDAGAVAIGLPDEGAIRGAWNAIMTSITTKHPDATIEGMLLQRMTPGREVIIGMKRDATFGPVIVFGLGGIFVEILKDASTRIAPVSLEEARAQVRSIKAAKLLQGARGTAPVDEDALVAVIVALSRLALEHPEIEEIDLNPVMADEHGVTIVDARFMKKQ